MNALNKHIIKSMQTRFKYGENDCVLFIGRYFEKMGAPIFKTIEKTIHINRSNWPKSRQELEKVSNSFGYKNVGQMHKEIIKKIGFKCSTNAKDGDLILEDNTFQLGLGWQGGCAFLMDNGIVVDTKNFANRWSF